jgi:uncharacterized membrane protein YccC
MKALLTIIGIIAVILLLCTIQDASKGYFFGVAAIVIIAFRLGRK